MRRCDAQGSTGLGWVSALLARRLLFWRATNNAGCSRSTQSAERLLDLEERQSASDSLHGRTKSWSRGLMNASAAEKLQQLNKTYKSRRQLQLEEQHTLPRWVVHPHDIL